MFATLMVYMIHVGWLCFTSHRQRGHLETSPPLTVPCKGREARFLQRTHQESNMYTTDKKNLLMFNVKPYHYLVIILIKQEMCARMS